MNIRLIPIRSDFPKHILDTLSVLGDIIIVNGEEFDFSALPEGGTLPPEAIRCELFAGNVTRINGVITLTLLNGYGIDATDAAKTETTLTVISDGEVEIPK